MPSFPIPTTPLTPGDNPPQAVTSGTAFTNAAILIDRTVANGLNSIPAGTVVQIDIQFMLPGQTQWQDEGATFLQSGAIVTKGVTMASDSRSFGAVSPFPAGTQFRFVPTVTGQAVTIGGGSSQVALT